MLPKNLSWKFLLFSIVLLYNLIRTSKTFPTNECGQQLRNPKIVNGEEASQGEFPWLVSVKSKYGHFCAAFIIGKRTLLSAAHCYLERSNTQIDYIDGKVDLKSIQVVVGEFDQKEKENPIDAMAIKVDEIKIHPDYNSRSKENDIALIRLAEDITVHPNVQPVCMPDRESGSQYSGQKAIVGGWGRLYFDQPTSSWESSANILRKGQVTIWDSDKCSQTYNDKGFNFPKKSFLCAGGEGGTESCQGDSGGSLQIISGGKWIAIGIVSVGKACGESGLPGVYTDVHSFLDWIQENSY